MEDRENREHAEGKEGEKEGELGGGGAEKELGHGHSTSWKNYYFTERFNGKKQ